MALRGCLTWICSLTSICYKPCSRHPPPIPLSHCLGAPSAIRDSCGVIRPRPRTLRCRPVSPLQTVVHTHTVLVTSDERAQVYAKLLHCCPVQQEGDTTRGRTHSAAISPPMAQGGRTPGPRTSSHHQGMSSHPRATLLLQAPELRGAASTSGRSEGRDRMSRKGLSAVAVWWLPRRCPTAPATQAGSFGPVRKREM